MATTVGTGTHNRATAYPPQRKSFYAYGRFWVFYSDGSTMEWTTSTNGVDWETPQTARDPCTHGGSFSIFFDGTYVHYAYGINVVEEDLYYRRGLPDSDGNITWSAVEQTVISSGANQYAAIPSICCDADGYPFIAYRKMTDVATYYPYIVKSSENDGTWTTDSDTALSATNNSDWYEVVIPLIGSKVYILYLYNGVTIKGKLYSGSWGNEETASSNNISNAVRWSATSKGDDVYLVYQTGTTLKYRMRDYSEGTPWQSEENIETLTSVSTSPVITMDTVNNCLYCFWTKDDDHVYYKIRTTTWGNLVDWINETVDDLTANFVIESYLTDYGLKIGVIYMTKTSADYNIRHDYLTITVPSLPTDKIFTIDEENNLFRIEPSDLSEEKTISLT